MLRHESSAPIWLFSFVDLAFLLLIAFTQIGPGAQPPQLALGQIQIPRIESDAEPISSRRAAGLWQLRVHPVRRDDTQDRAPFELVASGQTSTERDRIDSTELASRLALLRARAVQKPILAPDRDSRSEDLLLAVGMLEDVWRRDRFVTVLPGPAVAAGPKTGSVPR